MKLIVSGDGELSCYYKRVADSLDLKANVDFTGFVSTEEIVDSVEEIMENRHRVKERLSMKH